ncbi:MAG: alpha-hydroxy-acid oxidizing protein [Bacillota bacterium]|nr:alpha-hydroxy-acid oxidizing protein [Bacillota bacterium]
MGKSYQNLLNEVRGKLVHCKACPVCNGIACGNNMPGPGCKAPGNVAARNYSKWSDILVNMDTIAENCTPCTKIQFFGKEFAAPIFAAPIGGIPMHYSDTMDDKEYNDILAPACREAGIFAFVGDSGKYEIFEQMMNSVKMSDGIAIPTIKPWNKEAVFQRIDDAKKAGAFAISMDIDGAGLAFLKAINPNAGSKTVEELREIIDYAKQGEKSLPFIIKGIMTVKGARKAVEAGADGIVVSNHGGRVQGGLPSTAEVLPEIVDAVHGKCVIIVDGGLRNGVDVFKALALGANAVLIGRPFVPAVYAGGAVGVKIYIDEITKELKDTMTMCGAASLHEINRAMCRFS